MIAFHSFEIINKCSIHGQLGGEEETCAICDSMNDSDIRGKIIKRKEMILMNKPFKCFYDDYYIPMLNKYAYHLPHVILLRKNETGKFVSNH